MLKLSKITKFYRTIGFNDEEDEPDPDFDVSHAVLAMFFGSIFLINFIPLLQILLTYVVYRARISMARRISKNFIDRPEVKQLCKDIYYMGPGVDKYIERQEFKKKARKEGKRQKRLEKQKSEMENALLQHPSDNGSQDFDSHFHEQTSEENYDPEEYNPNVNKKVD